MADVGVTEEGIVAAGVLVMTWDEVDEQRNLFRFNNSVLVKVSFSYSRRDWYDYKIFEKGEWANVKEVLTGKTGWYSDFAGKHSEASITFWDDIHLEEITNRAAIVEFHSREGYSDCNLEIIYDALDTLSDNGEITKDDNGPWFVVEED